MTDTLQLWGSKPCKSNVVKDKDYVGRCKRNQAKWNAYTTGNAYMLYVRNRTSGQVFRVQQYGKNVLQAVRRYYRRLDNSGDKWVWKCTQVVAVYSCVNPQTSQAGKLLCGQPQDRAPW
jgi:hypothetical protein